MRSNDKQKTEKEYIYGLHAVREVLQTDRVKKLLLQKGVSGKKLEDIQRLADEKKLPIEWTPKEILDSLSRGGVHQGVLAEVSAYQYERLETLLDKVLPNNPAPFFVILDSIEDPHNFGSILRTADAAGVDGIIIPKHRAVGVTPVVAKTSTGAVEYLPIAQVTNLVQAVQLLKNAGFWIFGTDMDGTDYRRWQATGAIALIIGNEGKGMGQLLKKQVDEMLTLPMDGHVQSLNASVAAGLLMYEAFRQRHPLG